MQPRHDGQDHTPPISIRGAIPPHPLIFLVGMPGVGKTYWGSLVGAHLHLPFTDLDAEITAREKATIPDLFARLGEDGFRRAEHEALTGLIACSARPAIIACGGGTPCFHNNMAHMLSSGIVIYLRATVPQLMARLQHSAGTRPLLENRHDLPGYIESILATRKSIYESANCILDVNLHTLVTFAEIISICTSPQ